MRQKDCRLTTGTKVLKKKGQTRTAEEKSRRMITLERKAPGMPSSSPTKNDTDSGKKSHALTAKTQTTDSAKKTAKTQNTESGRKTISKTPQDTDSRKKNSTTISKTPQDAESKKKTTTVSRITNNSNSGNSLRSL